MLATVAGASAATRAVAVVNANWEAGEDGGDGAFRFLVVTEDDQRHVVETTPAAATALLALCASPAALLWDPESRTLIAGGVRGTWIA